jgi:DNA polymerase-3 subunit alpha
VLGQYGSNLTENAAVLVKGKLSVRDEKDPQLLADSAIPLQDVGLAPVPEAQPVPKKPQTLYLKLPAQESREFRKLRPILHMFPGDSKLVLYFADTKKRMGGTCLIHELLLQELKELLGEDCVVLK